MSFFAKTQSGMSRSMIDIEGELVTKYYCKSERVLKISLSDVLLHFKSIDISTNSIEFIQRANAQEDLTILLHDLNQAKVSDCTFRFNQFEIPTDLFDTEHIVNDILSTFHVRFDQTAKQFKKTVTDLHNHKSTGPVTLEKTCSTPLQFVIRQLGTHYKVVYENDTAIKLVQTISGEDWVRIDLHTEYMKEFAGTILNDLTIYAKNDSDILFRSIAADEGAVVKDTRAVKINTIMHQYGYAK